VQKRIRKVVKANIQSVIVDIQSVIVNLLVIAIIGAEEVIIIEDSIKEKKQDFGMVGKLLPHVDLLRVEKEAKEVAAK
jgi:hypothetical protein